MAKKSLEKPVSASVANGQGDTDHNNRISISDNVDQSRSHLNIYLKQESIVDAYERCYGKSQREYDAKQTRADRRKGDYLTYIRDKSKNGEEVHYEAIFQVGDMGSAKDPKAREVYKDILVEYAKEWEERNPNLYAFNIALHMDESTPHLHVDYIPVAKGYKTGMDTRNSLDKAFVQQGIAPTKHQKDTATMHWQDRERDHIREKCLEHGLELNPIKWKSRDNLSIKEYGFQRDELNRDIEKSPVKFDDIEVKESKLNKSVVVVPKDEYYEAINQAKRFERGYYLERDRNEEIMQVYSSERAELKKNLEVYEEIGRNIDITPELVDMNPNAAIGRSEKVKEALQDKSAFKQSSYDGENTAGR